MSYTKPIYEKPTKAFFNLENILEHVSKGIVESQNVLDDLGRRSIVQWEESGIPPTVLEWAGCSITMPVYFKANPKLNAQDKTRLKIATAQTENSKVTFKICYREKSQDREDD